MKFTLNCSDLSGPGPFAYYISGDQDKLLHMELSRTHLTQEECQVNHGVVS